MPIVIIAIGLGLDGPAAAEPEAIDMVKAKNAKPDALRLTHNQIKLSDHQHQIMDSWSTVVFQRLKPRKSCNFWASRALKLEFSYLDRPRFDRFAISSVSRFLHCSGLV
jgi:hypothetical protein